jgi:hypothetical protein
MNTANRHEMLSKQFLFPPLQGKEIKNALNLATIRERLRSLAGSSWMDHTMHQQTAVVSIP